MATTEKPPAKLSHRMTSQDASFIYGESHSGPLHIGSLQIYDGPIDYDELVDHMAQRMHLLPRYRQKLTFVPFNLAHATFEDDPDFDVRNHLKCHSLPEGTDDKGFVRAAMDGLRADTRSQKAAVGDASVSGPRGRPIGGAVEDSSLPGGWRFEHGIVERVARFARGSAAACAARAAVGAIATAEHVSQFQQRVDRPGAESPQ